MDTIPGATIPGATNLALVLIFTGPTNHDLDPVCDTTIKTNTRQIIIQLSVICQKLVVIHQIGRLDLLLVPGGGQMSVELFPRLDITH
jgi:hypothetical protein